MPERTETLISAAFGVLYDVAERDYECGIPECTMEDPCCDAMRAKKARWLLDKILTPKPESLHPLRLTNPPERAFFEHWCKELGKPTEPVCEAKLIKGNETDLMHRAVIENIRKQPNAIEEARSFRIAINTGQTLGEVAAARGVSESTITNRLALLNLDVKKQKAIEAGTLKPTKALAAAKASSNGDGGHEESNGAATEPQLKRRSAKAIQEAMEEFAEKTPKHEALAWVLGLREQP